MATRTKRNKWRPVQIVGAVVGVVGLTYFGLCREDIVDRTALAVVASDHGDFVMLAPRPVPGP